MALLIVAELILSSFLMVVLMIKSQRSAAKVRPIDMAAFKALNDRKDEKFLRKNLSRKSFARIKRRRIGLTVRYIVRLAGNASAVMRLMATARLTEDPKIIEGASEVIRLATRVRLHCLLALVRLGVEFLLPELQLTPLTLAQRYQTLTASILRLTHFSGNELPSEL